MNLPTLAALTEVARTPAYSLGVLGVLVAVLAFAIRRVRRATGRTPAAVAVSALGAIVCTAYSGDTSWRFARDHLGMSSLGERSVMFLAAELALFSMALMARQNLRTTNAPGTPGVLVWVITGVQVIPAFSESGLVGGFVRAFVGPVMAAVLWHLAMGIELQHAKPGAASQSLPAVLVRELRERLLSRFGLAERGRDAAQITRDRWTGIATRRAAHLAALESATGTRARRLSRAHHRLAVAVDRTDAGVLEAQRAVLLDRIAAYRGASSLASMALTAPWERQPEPAAAAVTVERVPAPQPVPEVHAEAYPQILAGVPGPDSELSPPPRSVPLVVPAGTRLLPIVARPKALEQVRAEYVPEPEVQPISEMGVELIAQMMTRPEPVDDSPPPPAEDTLTPQARGDFLSALIDGATPSIRDLKARYRIGQTRAERIQTELKAALA